LEPDEKLDKDVGLLRTPSDPLVHPQLVLNPKILEAAKRRRKEEAKLGNQETKECTMGENEDELMQYNDGNDVDMRD